MDPARPVQTCRKGSCTWCWVHPLVEQNCDSLLPTHEGCMSWRYCKPLPEPPELQLSDIHSIQQHCACTWVIEPLQQAYDCALATAAAAHQSEGLTCPQGGGMRGQHGQQLMANFLGEHPNCVSMVRCQLHSSHDRGLALYCCANRSSPDHCTILQPHLQGCEGPHCPTLALSDWGT